MRTLHTISHKMERFILLSLISLLTFQSCTNNQEQNKEQVVVEFNEDLAKEITAMFELDQTAAYTPPGNYNEYTKEDWEEWEVYKDSVFSTNKKRGEEIFNKHGFPGFNLIGEEASDNFFYIVQHCDFDPDFQKRVLSDLKIKLEKGNASKMNYAYLTDWVNKNFGKKSIYGTQVKSYNEYGQALSYPLEDSVNVNSRRESIGLESLEEYLNIMTTRHFEMNKKNMLNRGITEPKLYEVPVKE